MKLYFIPFACSLATRIAVIEAGLDAEFVQVTPDATLAGGRPFRAISPMGYVPALEIGTGLALTEGQRC
jgi:glutathione S-transferase